MEYPNGPRDRRKDSEGAKDVAATKEDLLVTRLLLCLQESGLYGQWFEERLGELGFERMNAG